MGSLHLPEVIQSTLYRDGRPLLRAAKAPYIWPRAALLGELFETSAPRLEPGSGTFAGLGNSFHCS